MSASITLAGVVYQLPEKPLLGEVRAVSMAMSRKLPPYGEELEAYAWDQAADVVVVALKRPQPDWTRDSLFSQAIIPDELWAARRIILTHFGLLKEPKPGEEVAGVEQVGSGSTENSAPA
jgi:hypothetical protein